MIPTRKLSNGVEMPYLGFGTWKLKGEECSQMVKYALDTGYTAWSSYNKDKLENSSKYKGLH